RDELYGRPADAVGGSGHHEIVGATTAFEAAVLPDNVDSPSAINLSRYHGKRAQIPRLPVRLDLCDGASLAPACSSVGRSESQDGSGRWIVYGDDNSAPGLNKGLSTHTGGEMGSTLRITPRQSSISRGA